MSTIVLTKAELIAALEPQWVLAIENDKIIEAKHKAAELEWERQVKAVLREGLKLRGEGFKKWTEGIVNRYGTVNLPTRPSCPLRSASAIRSAIKCVQMSMQTKYTIDGEGRHRGLYQWLTWSPTPDPKTVC